MGASLGRSRAASGLFLLLLAPAIAAPADARAAAGTTDLRMMLARDAAFTDVPGGAAWPGGRGAARADVRGAGIGGTPDGLPAVTGFLGGGQISPVRAFLYSIVVPGLGELAQGSSSGLGFLAAEGIGWTGYAIYHQRGLNGEDAYRRYVDAHYSKAQYDSVVAQVYRQFDGGLCQTAGSDTTFDCQDLAAFLNLDPNTHSQHYYEDVGKLDKDIFGWRDWGDTNGDGVSDYNPSTTTVSFGSPWYPGAPWPAGLPPLTSHLRAHYQDMRRYANRQFSDADRFSWLIVVNHVASAFHAAWMAHRAGSGGEEGKGGQSLHVVVNPLGNDGSMHVALARTF